MDRPVQRAAFKEAAAGEEDEARTVLVSGKELLAQVASKAPAQEPLGALFPDVESAPEPSMAAELLPSLAPADEGPDPFQEVALHNPDDLPPPGEATSFFIAQAGVNSRNPWWKIAIAVGGGLFVLFLGFYLLTKVAIARERVATADEVDKEAPATVFSKEGVSALSDLLLGRHHAKTKAKVYHAVSRPKPLQGGGAAHPAGSSGEALLDTDATTLVKGTAKENASIKAALGSKVDVGPRMLQAPRPSSEGEPGGPPQEEVAKTVGKYQPAFQSCIETQLKRDPNFRGGKISITVSVGPSGVVKTAQIDKGDIDRSPLGECLKLRAKKMLFPAFPGADVEIQIPLVLSATM
jgi:hypothetical protein